MKDDVAHTAALIPGGAEQESAAVLPCDVLLPPATIIRKGTRLSVLLTALDQREKQPSIEPLEAYGWNRRVGNNA